MTQHLTAQSRTAPLASLQPAARLTVRVGPGAGQEFSLDRETVTLGSSPGNDLALPHESVQRRHARVIHHGNRWTVADLGWQATFLNDRPVGRTPRALRAGDVVRLGDEVELVFDVPGRGLALPDLSALLGRLPKPDAARVSAWAQQMYAGRLSPLTRRFDRLRPVLRTRVPPLNTMVSTDQTTVMLVVATVVVGVIALAALAVTLGAAGSKFAGRQDSALAALEATPAGTPAARATVVGVGADANTTPNGGGDGGALLGSVPVAQAADCINNSGFEDDVTVPDGTVVVAGKPITKTWRLRNTGTCAWDRRYRFKLIKGEAMAAPDLVRVPDAQANETADISVPLFAPKKPGSYTATWQMVGPDGEEFGWTVSVRIKSVLPPTPTRTRVPTKTPTPTKVPTPTITPTPGPEVHLWSDQPLLDAGQTTTLHVTVDDVAAAWLDGEAVIGGRGDWQIAPCFPTTYTLDLQMKNGEHAYRRLAVDVNGACTPVPKPDLAVEFSLAPGRVGKGKPVTLSFVVTNKGFSRAEGVDLVFDSGMKAARKVTLAADLALNPGEVMTATKSLAWGASGVYTTALAVDAGNWIVEADESNNRTTQRLFVK